MKPDQGKVIIGETVKIGHYKQDGIQLEKDKRIIDVVTDIAEYIPLENGMKMTAAALLERFLFSRKQQQVYVSQLSGGEKRRLYLLTILMENPNFLILDEPTNDLDIITLNVLEDFLMQFPGVVVIVTHDRYFMDKLVDHLFVFEGNGKIRDFNGVYTEYRLEQQEKLEQTRQESREENKSKESKPKSKDNSNTLTFEQRKELKRLEKKIEQLEATKIQLSSEFDKIDLTPEKIQELSMKIAKINEELEENEMAWMILAELA